MTEDLPKGWIEKPLAEVTEPRGEKVSPQDYPDLQFIGMDHVESQTTRIIGSVPASSMKSNAARFYANDVLYGRLRPYLNKVTQPLFDGLASAEFIVFPDTDLVKSDYLKYRLNAADFVSFAGHLNEGDRPRVGFDQIGTFPLKLPPLKEQKRIVAKIEELFSELDKGIENLKTAREQLKIYRQAVLKHAFEGKLTANWRKNNKDKLESAEELLERIKQERQIAYQTQLEEWKADIKAWERSGKDGKKPAKPSKPEDVTAHGEEKLLKLISLPHGWAWLQIKCLCDVVRGGSPRPAGDLRYYDGDIPFLKVADITRTSSAHLETYSYSIKKAGLQKTRKVSANTLLLSNSGATLGVPKICLIEATFNDGIAAFLGLNKNHLLYHYYFWTSKTKELRAINQGAAQPNLNTDLIKEVFFPVCSSDEMIEVTKEIEEKLSVCDQIGKEIDGNLQKTEALRQSILKRAFSGKLVAQDPKDDPAFVLLERIKAEKGDTKKKKSAA